MVWTEVHDLYMCREIIAVDPFTNTKKGTTKRSTKWGEVVDNLLDIKSLQFKIDNRAVRERYNLISTKLRRKLKKEVKESGIAPQMSECEEALEFLIEKEDAAEELRQDGLEIKKTTAEDRVGAEEVRRKAMERLGTTQKRKAGAERGQVKRRSNGNDTIAYLREKNEQMMAFEKSKIEMEQQKLESENKRHDDLIGLMQQQQQQQMQSFQMMMIQNQQQMQKQQDQQAELMVKLFGMIVKK